MDANAARLVTMEANRRKEEEQTNKLLAYTDRVDVWIEATAKNGGDAVTIRPHDWMWPAYPAAHMHIVSLIGQQPPLDPLNDTDMRILADIFKKRGFQIEWWQKNFTIRW